MATSAELAGGILAPACVASIAPPNNAASWLSPASGKSALANSPAVANRASGCLASACDDGVEAGRHVRPQVAHRRRKLPGVRRHLLEGGVEPRSRKRGVSHQQPEQRATQAVDVSPAVDQVAIAGLFGRM